MLSPGERLVTECCPIVAFYRISEGKAREIGLDDVSNRRHSVKISSLSAHPESNGKAALAPYYFYFQAIQAPVRRIAQPAQHRYPHRLSRPKKEIRCARHAALPADRPKDENTSLSKG